MPVIDYEDDDIANQAGQGLCGQGQNGDPCGSLSCHPVVEEQTRVSDMQCPLTYTTARYCNAFETIPIALLAMGREPGVVEIPIKASDISVW